VSKPKDALNRLSDLKDALNQASQALAVQLPPDVAAALQRFDDWNRLAPNAVGERLTSDIAAAVQRIKDETNAFNAGGETLAASNWARLADAQSYAIRLESPSPYQDLDAARRRQHSGVHPGRPKGRTEETEKIIVAWMEKGHPKPTHKVCDEIAKEVGIKPKGWSPKRIRNKIRSAIHRSISASSSGA
jgi:hypothetical protein